MRNLPPRCEHRGCNQDGVYGVMLWTYCLSHAVDELVEESGCPWLPDEVRWDIATENLSNTEDYTQHIIEMTRQDFLTYHNEHPEHFRAWVAKRLHANANKRSWS